MKQLEDLDVPKYIKKGYPWPQILMILGAALIAFGLVFMK